MMPRPDFAFLSLCLLASVMVATWYAAHALIAVFGQ
jgi:hypothetical protein